MLPLVKTISSPSCPSINLRFSYSNWMFGFFNGVKVPDGTYFYELILGPNMIKKGYVYVKGN
mgnify:CR=1 FL=1